MNDKMMVENIFTECQKAKEVWKESENYGAFCALYGLIDKWDLAEVYEAWKEAQIVLSNSSLIFILNNWYKVEGHGNTLNGKNGKIQLEFVAYLYQKKEKIIKIFTYSNDTNFNLIDLTTSTKLL